MPPWQTLALLGKFGPGSPLPLRVMNFLQLSGLATDSQSNSVLHFHWDTNSRYSHCSYICVFRVFVLLKGELLSQSWDFPPELLWFYHHQSSHQPLAAFLALPWYCHHQRWRANFTLKHCHSCLINVNCDRSKSFKRKRAFCFGLLSFIGFLLFDLVEPHSAGKTLLIYSRFVLLTLCSPIMSSHLRHLWPL